MTKKIILLFDGTWNNSKDRTNVVRLRESIDSSGRDDADQPCFYDTGVGTHWYDHLTGGAFGRGLSRNIREGYRWLCGKYQPGDEVFVSGFSRGAYAARSLVGMIRKCGVLQSPHSARIEEAYELYRNKDIAPDDEIARTFRTAHAREIRVRFIGVWDTVGALGIPISHVPFSRDFYRWHDMELSKIVDFAYQAIATDERRKDYEVAVWTKVKPENQKVEQRWFIGAHANVGGGYTKNPVDTLPNPPLRWIQDKAEGAGLKFRTKAPVVGTDCLAEVNDSFREFMHGAYKIFKHPLDRPFGTGVNESVDDSVWSRWKEKPDYRPASLISHPERPR